MESQIYMQRFIRYTADFNRRRNSRNSRNSRIWPGNRVPPHVRPAPIQIGNTKITAKTSDGEKVNRSLNSAYLTRSKPSAPAAFGKVQPKIRQQSHLEGCRRHRIKPSTWTKPVKRIPGVIQPQSFKSSHREEDHRRRARDGQKQDRRATTEIRMARVPVQLLVAGHVRLGRNRVGYIRLLHHRAKHPPSRDTLVRLLPPPPSRSPFPTPLDHQGEKSPR